MITLPTWVLYAATAAIVAEFALCCALIVANLQLRFRAAALVQSLARRDEADKRSSAGATAATSRERWPRGE